MSSASTTGWILYDGDCPFCHNYVALLRLREAVGPLRIVNAREGGPEAEYARSAGLDLDEGMVLHLDGQLHHGADCMRVLAALSDPRGIIDRLLAWTFVSGRRARALYPLLRFGRNLTLRTLGRRRLGQSL